MELIISTHCNSCFLIIVYCLLDNLPATRCNRAAAEGTGGCKLRLNYSSIKSKIQLIQERIVEARLRKVSSDST